MYADANVVTYNAPLSRAGRTNRAPENDAARKTHLRGVFSHKTGSIAALTIGRPASTHSASVQQPFYPGLFQAQLFEYLPAVLSEHWRRPGRRASYSQQTESIIMRGRKNADDGPGIRSDGVPLLGRTQEEMKISLQKRIAVLLAHFGKRMRFVAIGHPQAIPVESSNLPVEDL
jgi:hypothetical protein